MTEKKLNIHQRINAIMKAISYVQKGDKKVNNQYTFVSHDAVTKAIHPLLVEHGVNIIPTVTESSIEWTSYKHYDKYNKVEVDKFRGFTRALVDISFVNIDDTKDVVTISQVGYGIDEQDKGIGKAVSYACKYAMLKVFMLETGDDPEKDLIEHKPAEKKEKPNFTKELLALNMTDTDMEVMLRKIKSEFAACESVEERQEMLNSEQDAEYWHKIILLANKMFAIKQMSEINKLAEGLSWKSS